MSDSNYRTSQEIFDIACEHLAKQGVRSLNKSYDGLYRGPRGRKCPIGALIPDDRYSASLEGFRVRARHVRDAARIGPRDSNLAVSIQVVHDDHAPLEWPSLLAAVCADYELCGDALHWFGEGGDDA